MSVDPKTTAPPTYGTVVTDSPEVTGDGFGKRRSYKKYAIIAVVVVLSLAIVLTAILVGMYMFTEGQKNILKFTIKRDEQSKEEVTSDPNANIVQYHVTKKTYESWIVDDFNKDIQVMKIQKDNSVACYVTPLNRTMAADPDKLNAPYASNKTNVTYLTYLAASNTIPDTSFLHKIARNTCSGVSTYWIYPSCEDDVSQQRNRRACSYYEREACFFFVCKTVKEKRCD